MEKAEVKENSATTDMEKAEVQTSDTEKAEADEYFTGWSIISRKMIKLYGFDENAESWRTVPRRMIKLGGFDIGKDKSTDHYECVFSFFMKSENGRNFLKQLARDTLGYLKDVSGKEYEFVSILKAAMSVRTQNYYITFSARQKEDTPDVVKIIQSINLSLCPGSFVLFIRFQPAPNAPQVHR